MFSHSINGISLTFETQSNLFSPTQVDKGTLAMLSAVTFSKEDKLLDLGCGYGVVGIYAAHFLPPQNIIMTDNNKDCIRFAQKNAVLNDTGEVTIIHSNGFEHIPHNDFTLILSNPPYHVDFAIPKHFIEKGFNRLVVGGKLYMVTKRRDWYKNKITAIFGGVRIIESEGYFVFCAEKRSTRYANK